MKRGPRGKTRERIYQFVRERLLAGNPPTIREVQHAFRFKAVQTAREHLEKLVAENLLTKEPGRSRGYRLPYQPGNNNKSLNSLNTNIHKIPILGRVQAGEPSLAVEDPDGFIETNRSTSGNDLFALRIQGESMTGAGIFPKDLVIVRGQPKAESGDIVVAIVDDEATVKRLQFKNNHLELHPENPDYSVIIPKAEDCRILGKVIEIRRYLE